MKYIEANQVALEAAPFGLYTVVPPHTEYKAIAPGVIFCFRQEEPIRRFRAIDTGAAKAAPPRPSTRCSLFPGLCARRRQHPFRLAHPKQILDICRIVCSGKGEPYTQLCNLFDQRTNHGTDMKAYNVLLQKAVDSVAATFRKRVASVQSGRGFVLPNAQEQVHDTTDLELVTWLVIPKP